MIRALVIAGVLLSAGAGYAQQQPDPAALQKAIMAYRSLLISANDRTADAETRSMLAADEIARLNARVQELEKAAAKTKPENEIAPK